MTGNHPVLPPGVYRGGVLVPGADPASVKPKPDRVWIDGVECQGATADDIRAAVEAGARCTVQDATGIVIEITRDMLTPKPPATEKV